MLIISLLSLFLVCKNDVSYGDSPKYYLTIDKGTAHTFNGVPFEINGVYLPVYRRFFLGEVRSIQKQRFDLSGYTADNIHIIQHSGYADNVPDNIVAGHINVYYKDGSSEALDLIMGQNTAEWSYDSPNIQRCLRHTKIPPAYTYWARDRFGDYPGHRFYISIDTELKPLDYLELILDSDPYTNQQFYGCSPADWFAIDISAVTLEIIPSLQGLADLKENMNLDYEIKFSLDERLKSAGILLNERQKGAAINTLHILSEEIKGNKKINDIQRGRLMGYADILIKYIKEKH